MPLLWTGKVLLYFQSHEFCRQEDDCRRSRSPPRGSCLGDTKLVYRSSGVVDRPSSDHQSEAEHSRNPRIQQNSSYCGSTPFDGSSYIRKALENREFSEKSVEILMASWRRSTQKQYSSYVRKWVLFCSEKKTDIFQTPIELVIEFLTELFNQGYSYQSLNSARSALSA